MEKFIKELSEFITFESVSTGGKNQGEIKKCAKWLCSYLQKMGAENVEIKKTGGAPIVYGKIGSDPNKPTILLYGHFDVVPAGDSSSWKSPPFKLTERNGNLYGRGVSDDKGPVLIFLHAINEYQKTRKNLPVNFKFMLESEEETGSLNTMAFVKENGSLLRCDAIIVAENWWKSEDSPLITKGVRGVISGTIVLKGPNRDLHSGTYGGVAVNPANILVNVLSKLRDASGKIAVPHFYDGIKGLSNRDREEISSLPFDPSAIKKDIGVDSLLEPEKGFTLKESNHERPTLDIIEIKAGDQGKPVIPSVAEAKLSCRIVSGQNAELIIKALRKMIEENLPKGIKLDKFEFSGFGSSSTDIENKYVQMAMKALSKVTGKKVSVIMEPCSLPLASVFGSELKVPIVYYGNVVISDGMHGPDEKYSVARIKQLMESIGIFFDLMGA